MSLDLGSGENNWLGTDRLIDETWVIGTRYLGFQRNATLYEAVLNYEWNLRSRGRRVYPHLYARI
ncbi:hypothetical protein YC2023_066781 [Brassica napus]